MHGVALAATTFARRRRESVFAHRRAVVRLSCRTSGALLCRHRREDPNGKVGEAVHGGNPVSGQAALPWPQPRNARFRGGGVSWLRVGACDGSKASTSLHFYTAISTRRRRRCPHAVFGRAGARPSRPRGDFIEIALSDPQIPKCNR